MNQKQRKAKLKRANQHRLAYKGGQVSNDLPAYIDDQTSLNAQAFRERRQELFRMCMSGEMKLPPFDEIEPKRNGLNMAVITLLAVLIGLPLVACGIAILIG